MENLLDIKYEKFILSNGLEVVLYPNNSFPTVSVNIWYKVGSANEKPNKTGFAHLFEHMMFQGSQNIDKEMHFKYVQEAGGNLNGSTSMDRTNYYESLPPDSLELALWLESDRMGFLLPALTQEKLNNQKDVVMNERRQNYDNRPYGLAWELLFSNLFPVEHPYHWPTIGWMEDIERFELQDVKDFFRNYYSPNNASLVIGGNFNSVEAKKLVKKYFDNIESGKKLEEINTDSIELNETKKVVHKDNVQISRIYFAWHSDKAYSEDDAALDILADILAGSKNSRLYKNLVHDLQIAQDVSAFQYSAKYNGVLFLIVSVKHEIELSIIREKVFETINELIKSGVNEKEVVRAVNGYKSSFIYSLQNLDNMTNQINNYNCNLKEPNSFLFDLGRYNKLNTESIDKVAAKYLTKNHLELDIISK
jgi:zinc protease